ncbi:lysozyme [Defluviimonas denitrificans]|jgi:lysozyme|uniref:Lysozyme n=1 Tax=Albidovulum denitrificans TaxID=404881 RepID=A0A2S8S6G2_9RHOB|nr:peptidoglycan-binding protein [Defluviimonas denitrificans]PQV56390.1 lysozyme [Defluviimonas denitrificans]
MDMEVSHEGLSFLERHEGIVLRAYRDAVGVLTIGAGLTKASGVVDPKPGMTITAEEASRLLTLALRRNYEPAVRYALSRYGQVDCAQHEFDGALSFHFNTGAIKRASWVDAWHMDNRKGVRAGLLKWVKGGGKVLPGLQRRRAEEADLILDGTYGSQTAKPKRRPGMAVITLRLSDAELADVRKALKTLGYDPGPNPDFVAEAAVRAFQERHALTVDGILGRATLTTLQRRLDARTKTGTVAAAGGAGGAATQVPGIGMETSATAVGVVLICVAIAGLYLAWTYRDVVAAKIQRFAPKSAAWLRSK